MEQRALRAAIFAIKAVILAPLFAAYALWCALSGWLRLSGRIQGAKRLLAPTISCPSCGRENALAGRWRCASCQARYQGYVGRCSHCGAGATFFPCEACGISIRLVL